MVEVEIRDGIAIVWLDAGRNEFDQAFVDALATALDQVERDGAVVGMVTTGREKHFSNGFDLAFLGSLGPSEIAPFVDGAMGVLARILTFPVPTVAALNGHAFGIGAMLAVAHDVRMMRIDRGWLCFPEVDLGMRFHPFMQALMLEQLPPIAVHEAVLTGDRYDGAAAVAAGFATAAHPEGELLDRAIAEAQRRSGKGREILRALKQDLHAPVLAHLPAP